MAMLKSWHEGGAGLQLYDKVDGKYVYSGSASLTRPTSSSQGRASGRSDEKYVAAKADYEKALAEWEGALERCDNMGIGADEINRLAANSRWADLLGTLGTMNKQEAARKALVAKERLERAKARLEALDWKE